MTFVVKAPQETLPIKTPVRAKPTGRAAINSNIHDATAREMQSPCLLICSRASLVAVERCMWHLTAGMRLYPHNKTLHSLPVRGSCKSGKPDWVIVSQTLADACFVTAVPTPLPTVSRQPLILKHVTGRLTQQFRDH